MKKYESVEKIAEFLKMSVDELDDILIAIGLKYKDKYPSKDAFFNRYIRLAQNSEGFFYTWDVCKTIHALKDSNKVELLTNRI